MTNIFLMRCWVGSPEMKQVEVTCHLMYADFSCVSFYTLEVRKWVTHGEQCLSLMRASQVVQPLHQMAQRHQEDNYGITRAVPNHDGAPCLGGR